MRTHALDAHKGVIAVRRDRCSILLALVVLEFCVAAAAASAQQSLLPSDPQAIITPTEARFIFPLGPTTYVWNKPRKGGRSGELEYLWEIQWSPSAEASSPELIWLTTSWGATGPTRGSLAELIHGRSPTVMIHCGPCDENAVYEDLAVDSNSVSASVDNNRLVIAIRGKRAVSHVFPKLPDKVSIGASLRDDESGYGAGQTVLVNCGSALSAAAYHSKCIVPPPRIPPAPPNADSAAQENAPRLVYIIVLSFAGPKLMKNVPVVLTGHDAKPFLVTVTDSLGHVVLHQPPLWQQYFVEVRCPRNQRNAGAVMGSAFLQILPRMDATLQITADPRICDR